MQLQLANPTRKPDVEQSTLDTLAAALVGKPYETLDDIEASLPSLGQCSSSENSIGSEVVQWLKQAM